MRHCERKNRSASRPIRAPPRNRMIRSPRPRTTPGPGATSRSGGGDAAGVEQVRTGQGSYNAEFAIAVRCSREPCTTAIDVVNGELIGAPQKVHDEKLVKIFKMKAQLHSTLDLREFPFDQHVLPILLEERRIQMR